MQDCGTIVIRVNHKSKSIVRKDIFKHIITLSSAAVTVLQHKISICTWAEMGIVKPGFVVKRCERSFCI